MDTVTRASTNSSVQDEELQAISEHFSDQGDNFSQNSHPKDRPVSPEICQSFKTFTAKLMSQKTLLGYLPDLPKLTLQVHGKTHPFPTFLSCLFCPCGSKFSCNSNLTRHILRSHPNNAPPGILRTKKQKIAYLQDHASRELMRAMNEDWKGLLGGRTERDVMMGEVVNGRRLRVVRRFPELGGSGGGELGELAEEVFVGEIGRVRKEFVEGLEREMTVDRVMALYLYNLSKHVKPSYLKYVEEVFIAMRWWINKELHKKIREFYIITKLFVFGLNLVQEEYCSMNDCEYIPLIAGDFIQKMSQQPAFLDKKLLEDTTMDFFDWIYENCLTEFKILEDFNYEHKLIKRLKQI